ncbi:MAG: hypothetical protein MUO76_21510, partial [Anaerolineaceae bacterium]|nr:hypothetical protein [Anaerolineaceae bacterium]
MKAKIEQLKTFFDGHTALFILVIPLILIASGASLFGSTLIERIIITMFINLILVLGLQLFMGNSGILNFSHIGFMGIGAYASVILSMTPQAKSIGIQDLYPVLNPIHLPFLISLFLGGCIPALIAA